MIVQIKKKCHLKNDKVEHVLQNHTQIFSPWKKKTHSNGCAKT